MLRKFSLLCFASMLGARSATTVKSIDHSPTNETAILDAEEAGELTVERTDIVINCPIVATASGGRLPGVTLSQ